MNKIRTNQKTYDTEVDSLNTMDLKVLKSMIVYIVGLGLFHKSSL